MSCTDDLHVMSHVSHERVTFHTNKSFFIRIIHVSHEWNTNKSCLTLTLCPTTAIQKKKNLHDSWNSHKWVTFHASIPQMSHVSHEWITNKSCLKRIWSHATAILKKNLFNLWSSHKWVTFHANMPQWVMSHTNKSQINHGSYAFCATRLWSKKKEKK